MRGGRVALSLETFDHAQLNRVGSIAEKKPWAQVRTHGLFTCRLLALILTFAYASLPATS